MDIKPKWHASSFFSFILLAASLFELLNAVECYFLCLFNSLFNIWVLAPVFHRPCGLCQLWIQILTFLCLTEFIVLASSQSAQKFWHFGRCWKKSLIQFCLFAPLHPHRMLYSKFTIGYLFYWPMQDSSFGFPWWLSWKFTRNCYQWRNMGSILEWRRFLGGGSKQPTPVFLPEKSHGQRSLIGYNSPWSSKASDDWWAHT